MMKKKTTDKISKDEIKLAAIGAIVMFSPDEIELKHEMKKDGRSVMTLIMTDNSLSEMRKAMKEMGVENE